MQPEARDRKIQRAYRFCWFPTNDFNSLEAAVAIESQRVGFTDFYSNLVLANTLVAIDLLQAGKLKISRDYKKLAAASNLPMFELRVPLSVGQRTDQLRIYFGLPSNHDFAVGLLVRFKRLDGTREQIRSWQNQDIAAALKVFQHAEALGYQICIAERKNRV